MSQLEMSPAAQKKIPKIGLILGVGALCLLLVGGTFLLLRKQTAVSSSAAVAGLPGIVLAPYNGVVKSVLVEEGQVVEENQALAALDDAVWQQAAQEARAGLLAAGLPDGISLAERSAMLEDLSAQIAILRQQEAEMQKFVEHWTAEHARAMLILRNPSSDVAARQSAVQAEAYTREQTQASRNQLDAISRQRAALDARQQEMRRFAESQTGLAGQAQAAQYWSSLLYIAENNIAKSVLRATKRGVVTQVGVAAGLAVPAGGTTFVVSPYAGGTQVLVHSVFSPQYGASLVVGQKCSVILQGGSTLSGTIESVEAGSQSVSVNAMLDLLKVIEPVYAGQPAEVRVSLR